jgi:hypothetical protein
MMVFGSDNHAFAINSLVKRPETWSIYSVVVGENQGHNRSVWMQQTTPILKHICKPQAEIM